MHRKSSRLVPLSPCMALPSPALCSGYSLVLLLIYTDQESAAEPAVERTFVTINVISVSFRALEAVDTTGRFRRL